MKLNEQKMFSYQRLNSRLNPVKIEDLSEADKAKIPELVARVLGLKEGLEVDKFKDRIVKANGVLRIFVHPFYRDNKVKEMKGSDLSAYNSYRAGILKHLEKKLPPPILVFEESNIKRNELSENIIIPTEMGNGSINANYLFELFKDFDFYKNEACNERERLLRRIAKEQNLISDLASNPERLKEFGEGTLEILQGSVDSKIKKIQSGQILSGDFLENYLYSILFKTLRVKKVIVGGMYVSVSATGCLSHVIQMLNSVGILTRLSNYHMDFYGKKMRKL